MGWRRRPSPSSSAARLEHCLGKASALGRSLQAGRSPEAHRQLANASANTTWRQHWLRQALISIAPSWICCTPPCRASTDVRSRPRDCCCACRSRGRRTGPINPEIRSGIACAAKKLGKRASLGRPVAGLDAVRGKPGDAWAVKAARASSQYVRRSEVAARLAALQPGAGHRPFPSAWRFQATGLYACTVGVSESPQADSEGDGTDPSTQLFSSERRAPEVRTISRGFAINLDACAGRRSAQRARREHRPERVNPFQNGLTLVARRLEVQMEALDGAGRAARL